MAARNHTILQGAAARNALLHGMTTMSKLVGLTLGPRARTIAIARAARTAPPEVLDDAATIVRRTIQLTDPYADMGGMLLRHLVWRQVERAGDGGATAAVIAERLVREGGRYLAAGGNPLLIKRGIELGLDAARAALRAQARSVETPDALAGIAAGMLRDPELATLVGEVLDAVGPDGAVLVEDGQSTTTVEDYHDGVNWNQGYASPYFLRSGETVASVLEPRLFITDYVLERAEHVLPALEACVGAGGRSLVVIAPEIRDTALALLLVNRDRGVLDGALAIKAPAFGAERSAVLDDLAALTGGRCLSERRYDRLAAVNAADLGAARQVNATHAAFNILGGRGQPDAIRQRLGQLKTQLGAIRDDAARRDLEVRIGKLTGLVATIRVGAPTAREQAALKGRVEAAVRAGRVALQDGGVPGGGAALLACVPAVANLPLVGDAQVGGAILARALEEPLRAIAANAGLDASLIVAAGRERDPGWVFDVTQEQWVEAWAAGIIEPLGVTLAALETGVSAGVMALTTEVLVRCKQPQFSAEP